MSTRCTVLYGRFGHLYWDAYAYFWQTPKGRIFELPFRRPWRWLAMYLYRRNTGAKI